MKKIFVLAIVMVCSLTLQAQEKKSKPYKQHKSTETGTYVTKKRS